MEKDNEDSKTENLNENYEKELAEFTEAAKKLIKEKVISKEMQNKQRIIGLLQRYASDMFGGKDGSGKKSVIDVNVTNIKNDKNDDESSYIVSVEMSSKKASCSKSGPTKRARRAAKKCAKKTQMTITAVIEESADGTSQQLTITKDKSGSLSISGVSIQKKDKATDQNRVTTEDNKKMTTEGIIIHFNESRILKINIILSLSTQRMPIEEHRRSYRDNQIPMCPLSRCKSLD